jgi:hypothetical protein
MPKVKKENIVIHFFKRNWPQITVITVLLLVCRNDYIATILDYKGTFQIVINLAGLTLGCLILATAVMLLLRLIEWGLSKL